MTWKKIEIGDLKLDVFEKGTGTPLLFLHGGQGFSDAAPFVEHLAKTRRVIAPSHPGFGDSDLPDWLDRMDDIAYVYLELLDHLNLDRVDVVGCSIGGWIGAELATMVPRRIARLVLVGPVGVKTGPADQLDVPDIFVMGEEDVERLLYDEPEKFRPDPAKLADEELAVLLRNRES